MALAAPLGELGGGEGPIKCQVITRVDHPKQVFDTYGRMVGNVFVNGQDINLWLLREGWAFPTLNNSMDDDEIEAVIEAAKAGARKRMRRAASQALTGFDWDLVYRKEPGDDDR